ncbi:MAG: tyrosine-type recombinase/integrase [Candidatus Woesearchaeota archaeon]
MYSYGDFERVLKTGCRLAKHARDKYGVTDLKNITKEIADDYIQTKVDSGCTRNYIMTEKYGVKKLDKSMLNTGRRSKYAPSIASDIPLPKDDSEPYGHYNDEEVEIIMAETKKRSEPVYNFIEAQKNLGTRASETLNMQVEDIDLHSKEVSVVGKGGRPRIIDIPDNYISKLEELTKDKELSNLVFGKDTGTRNVQKIVKDVCENNGIDERGSHGFRGYAAYKKMKEKGYSASDISSLIEKHGNALTAKEKEDLRDISKFLGHNRIRIIKDHYLQR